MTLVYLWNTNENAFDEIWLISVPWQLHNYHFKKFIKRL